MKHLITLAAALALGSLSLAGTYSRGPVSAALLGSPSTQVGEWSIKGTTIDAYCGPDLYTANQGRSAVAFRANYTPGFGPYARLYTGCPLPPPNGVTLPNPVIYARGCHWFQPRLTFKVYWQGTGPADTPPALAQVEVRHLLGDQHLGDEATMMDGGYGSGTFKVCYQSGQFPNSSPSPYGEYRTIYEQTIANPSLWEPSPTPLLTAPAFYSTGSAFFVSDPGSDPEEPYFYRYSADVTISLGWLYISGDTSGSGSVRTRIQTLREVFSRVTRVNGVSVP